jgi:GAF domain-containing protein
MTGTAHNESLAAQIEKLVEKEATLQKNIEAVLVKNMLENVGQLGLRRLLPDVSRRIVSVMLGYLQEQIDESDVAIHLTELIEMGLRQRATLIIADTLVETGRDILAADSEMLSHLRTYRHSFLLGYMTAMNEYIIREREAVHENMGAAVETQVRVERQLRRDLEKQAQQLQTVAEISTIIASTLNTDELLDKVTDLTRERFGLYHVHIYLLDERGKKLKLAAGSGAVGQTMVKEGHTIALNQQSLVARAARSRQGAIVNDVSADPDYLSHALLSDTRAEMVMPLVVGDTILGVLDVQADQANYFTEEDLRIQTTLASQIAVALQNAASFTQSEAARQELDMLTRRLTREGWQEFVQTTAAEDMRYAYDLQQVFSPENGRSTSPATIPALKQSLVVQGAEIGQLWLDEPQTMTAEAGDIVAAVAERLSLHIENLRLSTQTEQALAATETQAQRLEMLNTLGAELSAAQSTEDLFRAAARHTAAILNADRTSITLLQTEEQMLELVWLEGEVSTVPLGSKIPIEGTAAGAAITSRRVISIPDTRQSQFAAVSSLQDAGILSSLDMPMTTQSGVLGTLNVGSRHPHAFDSRAENLLRQIASLLASTMERQTLFDQTQAALGETATLYDISAQLNAAANAQEVVRALGKVSQADTATLLTFSLDDQGQPEWMRVTANWPPLGDDAGPITAEFPVATNPTSRIWLENPHEPVFVSDRDTDERLDEASRLSTAQFGIESMIWLPLYLNKEWLGMVVINWMQKRKFSEREQRIYRSLMGQTAVVVNQFQLLSQTQDRATQLEELTELEALLSQANDETELVSIILNISQSPTTASLYHVEAAADGAPLTAHLSARWVEEHMETAVVRAEQSVFSLPAASIWTQTPNRLFLVGDVAQETELTEIAQKSDTRALAALPLHSGGRWHGVMLLEWDRPHTFTEKEEFLLRQMLEPVSAVFASQRALAETEMLYQASARLNTVQTYDEILDVLRQHTIAGREARLVSLNLFDRPWSSQQEPTWVDVIAYWSSFTPKQEIMTYRLADYPGADLILKPDQAIVVTNAQTDERLSENAHSLIVQGYKATSALFVPLVTANQWRGYVSAFYEEETAFPEAEIRRLMVLAAQAAVAIQSLRLLRQTEQQLANLTNIQQTTASLSGALSFDEALATFLHQVCQSVAADSADIYTLEGQVINRIGVYPMTPDKPVQFSCTLDQQPMMLQAVTTRQAATLAVQDQTVGDALRQSFTDAGIMANATIPLLGRTGTFGILSVNREQETRQFSEQELNLLQTLSDQAIIAFERVQLLEEATQRAEHEQRLREITTRVRSSIDVDAIMRTAVQEVGRVLGRRTFIYLEQDAENGSDQPEEEPQIAYESEQL